MREIGIAKRLYSAIALPGMLVSQIWALWFLMHACRIALLLFAEEVAFLIVRFGTMIPNAPANVGSVYFVALTLPLWTLGLLSLTGSGVSLRTSTSSIVL